MIVRWSIVVCLCLAGCAITPRAPEPNASAPSETRPLTAAERAASRAAGRQAVRDFLAVIETVEPVAEQICKERSPQRNCDFQIVVDKSPDAPPNAFQTLDDTGRPIIAFTVPLIVAVRNRDEMAFIMSHEAAHHIRGHLQLQRQNATFGATIFGQVAGVFGAGNAEAVQAAQEFGAVIGARSYSKSFELEADAMGTEIAARAGYDPVRGAAFFTQIPDPGNRFLGTHPANADRVETVRATAAGMGL